MGFVNVSIDGSIEELLNRGERNTTNIVKAGFNQITDETLEDPYDSIWLQLIAVFVYLLIILSSCLMMAFTYYEQDHGHYRTVINQLLTNLYNVVCIDLSKIKSCTYLIKPNLRISKDKANPSYSQIFWIFLLNIFSILQKQKKPKKGKLKKMYLWYGVTFSLDI